MLHSVVAGVESDVGQLILGCKDFEPSGQSNHPEEGVTQVYTCRRLAPSLMNSVHHFEVRAGFRWERSGHARVNHYKYQAWDEFKVKFRRRVSTYVADWTDRVSQGSKEAVEPEGWPNKFCEVEDTMLRDATRRWFGFRFTTDANKLPPLVAHPPPT